MAGRARSRRHAFDIWPGFVDALTSLLIIMLFVVTVFLAAQFVLGDALSGRDRTITDLNRRIDELATMLALEKEKSDRTAKTAEELSAELRATLELRDKAVAERDRLAGEARDLAAAKAGLDARVKTLEEMVAALQADKARLEARIKALEAETATAERRAGAAEGERAELAQRLAALEALVRRLETEKASLEARLAALAAEKAGTEKRAATLDADKAALEAQIRALDAERARLAALAQRLEAERDRLAARAESAEALARQLAADKRSLEAQLAALAAEKGGAEKRAAEADQSKAVLEARLRALEAEIRKIMAERDQALARLGGSEQALAGARRLTDEQAAQLALLNRQIAALRQQLAAIQAALEAAEVASKDQKLQIDDLSRRLNAALATKVQELQRYRSEFFGRLREVLGNRTDIRIVGDRFVFASEVLFPVGSDELSIEGRERIADIAKTLKEVSARIPKDIPWVLRVDGHTDKRPIRGKFPSNWELSSARAIAVVKYLIEEGIPAQRLVAAGFGEHQPLDGGESEEAYARNRRIELKITER